LLTFILFRYCNTLKLTALQNTATCCNTLQHSATLCNTPQHIVTHCNALLHYTATCFTRVIGGVIIRWIKRQQIATHGYTLQHTATHCNTLQQSISRGVINPHIDTYRHQKATRCNTLQRIATDCNTLQCNATHCNTWYQNDWQGNCTTHLHPQTSNCRQDLAHNTMPVFQCVVVCCSVLQCVAVCCSVLQCDAVCCSVLQCVRHQTAART